MTRFANTLNNSSIKFVFTCENTDMGSYAWIHESRCNMAVRRSVDTGI